MINAPEELQAARSGSAAVGAVAAPSAFSILAQYIKSFSLESPDTPQSLNPNEQPGLDFEISVRTSKLDEDVYDVCLEMLAKASADNLTMFDIRFLYNGIFSVEGINGAPLEAFLNIECARILFPFARQIISNMTQSAGFPPLMLEPVDFVSLYYNRGQAPGRSGVTPGGLSDERFSQFMGEDTLGESEDSFRKGGSEEDIFDNRFRL